MSDWDRALADHAAGERYGLVFVDQAPWEARAATVRRFRLESEYVILHDCDYLPAHGLLGRSVRELRGSHDVGERLYDDAFTAWTEYFPPEPWPLATTGPPTLLASNFHDCELEVDYAAHYGSRSLRLLARGAGRVESALSASAVATSRA